MEDGMKEDPVQSKEAKFLSKAGWVKKATGRVLAGYKDRYIHVEKTEFVVYENEDLQTCLERLDLENFDKCLELRSFFKKKNRLILIRAPKCGNKIHNIKIQVQSPEEKYAWIKALSEGINRAKNKVFDEVKVDESNNLEHVTRTRPRGNRGRRPPTRIHMKEVANISSDGILRLDLDHPDSTTSNGTLYVNVEIKDPANEAITVPRPSSSTSDAIQEEDSCSAEVEEPQTAIEPNLQKKTFKPPMPPCKDVKLVLIAEDGPTEEGSPEKVLEPPKPPSKDLKPSLLPAEEDGIQNTSETVTVSVPSDKTEPLTAPQNISVSSSKENVGETLPSVMEARPPTPPPSDKKPRLDQHQTLLPLDLEGTSDEIKEKEGQHKKNEPSLPTEALPNVKQPVIKDISESATRGLLNTSSGQANNVSNNKYPGLSESTPIPPSLGSPSLKSTRKSPSPLPPPKKKPLLSCPSKQVTPVQLSQPENQPIGSDGTAVTQHENNSPGDTKLQTILVASVGPAHLEEPTGATVDPNVGFPGVVLTLSEPVAIDPDLSQQACRVHAEAREKIGGRSSDDDDSEDSGSEATLATSTYALRGSPAALDAFYASLDDGDDPNGPRQFPEADPTGTMVSQVTSSGQINPIQAQPAKRAPKPQISLKPSTNAMSSSVGDLLSDHSKGAHKKVQTRFHNLSQRDKADRPDKATRTSNTQGEGLEKIMPEDLLAKAMEKLRMADCFFREAKDLKESKRLKEKFNRSSW